MNIVCQKDYLMQVRNAMLLHFGHREICDAVYFERHCFCIFGIAQEL